MFVSGNKNSRWDELEVDVLQQSCWPSNSTSTFENMQKVCYLLEEDHLYDNNYGVVVTVAIASFVQRIWDTCDIVWAVVNTIQNATNAVVRLSELCHDNSGGYFENFL